MANKIKKFFEIELPGGEKVEFEASASTYRTPDTNSFGSMGKMENVIEDVKISPAEMAKIKEALVKALEECDWF